jgi:hypothetical protein
MTFTISDSEAPLPLVQKKEYEQTDNSRTTMTKTVVEITGAGRTEEKSKFTVHVFSGAQNEDLIALIVTINQFKTWAEAKNM